MAAFHMDSAISQTLTRAVTAAGVLTCTKTSAHDVYANAYWVTPGAVHQFTIHQGDSISVPAQSTLTIWIFRKQAGQSTWTGDFDLS